MTLPSMANDQRLRRVRDVRRLLDKHRQIRAAYNDLVGCGCGAGVPNGLTGDAWHRDHLATELERAMR